MKKIIRFIKRLFGKYETGCEYWVSLSDIRVTKAFRSTKIGSEKFKRKWQFYHRNGRCESKIVLDKNFVLVNGYSSYKILRAAEGLGVKVPVYFVDRIK